MQHRIVLFTYDYPPNNGGIARLCYEIKKGLERHSIPVIVVTLSNENTDLENDKNVIRISGRRGIVEWKMLSYIRNYTTKDDIILTGTFHPDGLIGVLSGRKTYMLAHGAEFLPGKTLFRRVVWKIYRQFILKCAKCVIANSHYTERLVRECSPHARTTTIPLAVDTDYFHPTVCKSDDGLLHLCSISRLEKFKAQDFIIETIAALPEEYRNKIRLKIGGKGPFKASLEKLVKDLKLSRFVTFEGYIADDKLCDFYSAADIFILCTREEPENRNVEGFGLVFSEAQACGTAVIATETGGIPDAVTNGNGGWLIRQDSKEDLSNLLKQLIDDSSLKIEEGNKARNRMVDENNWDRYIKQLCVVLK